MMDKTGWPDTDKISYVLSVYSSIYGRKFERRNDGFESDGALVVYKTQPDRRGLRNALVILPAESHRKTPKSILASGKEVPVYHYGDVPEYSPVEGEKIIMRFRDGDVFSFHDPENNVIYWNADLLEASYLLLSRREEADSARDEFNRFPSSESINQNQFLPLVNYYFELLDYHLSILAPQEDGEKRLSWPNSAPYAVCLTHDVDSINKWWLKKALSYIFIKHDVGALLRSVGRHEHRNFRKIMKIEDEYGFRSTFFFLAIRRDQRPRYRLKSLKSTINELDMGGWEIGLHGSPASAVDSNALSKEREKLEAVLGGKVEGIRNHYLAFDFERTWNLQAKNGFSYDSTLGYSDTPGFRAGLSHPYPAYLKEGMILELPMILMDVALKAVSHRNSEEVFVSDKEEMKENIEKLLSEVRANKGLFVINWHQSYFDESESAEPVELYRWMLDRFKADGAMVAPCREVAYRWKKRVTKEGEKDA